MASPTPIPPPALISCDEAGFAGPKLLDDHPTLQVADVVAGATADVFQHVGEAPYRGLHLWVGEHLHMNTMLSDDDLIDVTRIEPKVDLAVLRELACRADKGEDPLEGIEDFYAAEFRRAAPGQRGLKRLPAAFARDQR
ncbi:hypothetical protein [Mesorhizobium shangrilense]|uniref:Uncharacterized protein n=1 Tax=Mesorhizobium shangrilense TaxID=460060 RepID=A0ABV2DN71_9HYPH